jgi:hypothetical protein
MVLKTLWVVFISFFKTIVFITAWSCELTGRMLVTISEALFKLKNI